MNHTLFPCHHVSKRVCDYQLGVVGAEMDVKFTREDPADGTTHLSATFMVNKHAIVARMYIAPHLPVAHRHTGSLTVKGGGDEMTVDVTLDALVVDSTLNMLTGLGDTGSITIRLDAATMQRFLRIGFVPTTTD